MKESPDERRPPRLTWRLAGTLALVGVALVCRTTAFLLDERREARARLDAGRRR